MSKVVKSKKKLNIGRTLVVILLLYVIISCCIYIYKEPIRHIEIKGNRYLTDSYIIRRLNLEDYPSYISINPKKLENILNDDEFIISSKIKFGFHFTIYIEIEENRPLMKQKSSNGILLSDGTVVEDDGTFIGLPVLLNDPTKSIIKELVHSLSNVDEGIIYTISEIEYKPSYNSKNQVIDDNRFLLYMNDGNHIYITANKAKLLNKYLDIAASTYKKGTGTLYLDSGIDSYLFTPNIKTTTTTKTSETTSSSTKTTKSKKSTTTKTTKKTTTTTKKGDNNEPREN